MGETPKIFIGLVTHPRSRFNSKGQASQKVIELANSLNQLGFNVVTLISDRNDFDLSGKVIGIADRVRSAWRQAQVEKAWNEYLRESTGSDSDACKHGAIFFSGMFVKRATSFLLNSSSLARLANIDFSHLRVLKEGVATGAEWVLIIEDDAQFAEPVGTADALRTVLDFLTGHTGNIFINLSESMDVVQLKVDGIVSCGNSVLTFANDSELVEVSPAISNTVCANIYSADFAQDFVSAIEAQGIFPSVPIDWRLNQLIMDSQITPTECYWVKPGLFLQGSMHGDLNPD